MTDIPRICSLSPTDLRDRVAQIHTLLDDALIDRLEIQDGLCARFRDGPDVAARLSELVAAERRCCPSLTFTLGREDGRIRLEITGGPESRPVIEQFFEAR